MTVHSGRHFLQIPGPTNVPDRILRAIDNPTIDHRGPEFAELAKTCLAGIKTIFQTVDPVIIYTASGTGGWEAALVNTLNPGDTVLASDTGQFAALWIKMARNLGFEIDVIPGDWRHGVDADEIGRRLTADSNHQIKAVLTTHNETATGITSNIAGVRKAMDAAKHPALLMCDIVSSLGSVDYRHTEWGVDVAVGGSQKGLMLPPGLSFNAISQKALEASKTSKMPKSFWRWDDMLEANSKGFFPYTPATNLIYGLKEAIAMLNEEGLGNVFCRHQRHGEATRRAVCAWGLELCALDPAEYSPTVTTVMMPDGFDEVAFRKLVLEKLNMSLGAGLGRLAGKAFRIGHLGSFNDLMLAGTLSGVQMGLELFGVPHKKGGVDAALSYLAEQAKAQ
ncbi:MAG TPA: aminotransferase class V-fold PLP-dependent enzyme [Bryobacteraceae bacterium]|jgi:alanine-glyoxylate transaminase/serine-glyoxylate transaminase/serine-pyruvate transaminase